MWLHGIVFNSSSELNSNLSRPRIKKPSQPKPLRRSKRKISKIDCDHDNDFELQTLNTPGRNIQEIDEIIHNEKIASYDEKFNQIKNIILKNQKTTPVK